MATVTPPRAQDAAVANDTPMPRAPQDAGVGDGAPEPRAQAATAPAGTPAPRAQAATATAGTPAPRAQAAKVGNGAPEPRAQATTATAGTPAPRAQDAAATIGAPSPREPTPTALQAPYALDGDVAGLRIVWEPGGVRLSPGHGPVRASLDPARRLTPLTPGGELLGAPAEAALSWARLATAAQALGVGLALLDRTVGHVKRRHQFGVPVGSFQAVKHRLADAKIALEFARPLVFGAALTLRPADVAAAKVAACEAAYATARTALHLHGAIGYTAEYDLSLWLAKARALRTAWGAPEECRALVVSAGDRRW
ncbi:acyl-CoA dehydrogenase family protein [Streptomyces sp. NPDC006251]|uniref:acyl-CoA dehydrogenase family protein n=1 Tax=Streptomyces sp. NPDC006251 TaxID=3155718 RepID=UPI0033BEAA8B